MKRTKLNYYYKPRPEKLKIKNILEKRKFNFIKKDIKKFIFINWEVKIMNLLNQVMMEMHIQKK